MTWDLIIASYETLASRNADLAWKALRSIGRKLLICASSGIRNELPKLFDGEKLTHLLAKNPGLDGDELLITLEKILGDDIFGIDKYFPRATTTTQVHLRETSERQALLDTVLEFVVGIGAPSRMHQQFVMVTDELITNALFNAPVDANGHRRYAHLSRAENVVLEPHEAITVTLSTDRSRLGISVSDPFGSLDASEVLSYLAKCFRRNTEQVDRKAGGAGLGIYYTFEALSHFIVNIEPRRCTEMIGIIDVRGTYKDFAGRAKSFNIFVKET
jgi:hypothetical protein